MKHTPRLHLDSVSEPFDPDMVPIDNEEEFLEWSRKNEERLAEAQRKRMDEWKYIASDRFKADIMETLRPEEEEPWEDGS